MTVRVLAPAKLNPWLEVLGRRDDGYHELVTTLLALELSDELEARTSDRPGVRLELLGPCASPDVPRDRSNLACAAAQALLSAAIDAGACARERGLELRLVKNVPSQAGLGGGSSDAAAALLAAERALDFTLPAERARRELAALGSDCVFFRDASATGFASCTGRGERVAVLPPIPRHWSFAVLTPAVAASTAAVYAGLARGLSRATRAPTVPLDVFERSEPVARALLFNRLEDASLATLPQLRAWRALLDEHDASHFRLCGSGSSFFGLFADAAAAGAALACIERAAHSRGLPLRGVWVTRSAGAGARLAPAN